MIAERHLMGISAALLTLSGAVGWFVTESNQSVLHWWLASTAETLGWLSATVILGCLAAGVICTSSWNYAHTVRPSLSRVTHFLGALPALLMVAGLRQFAPELGWGCLILPLSAMLCLELSVGTLETPEAWTVEAQSPLSRAELLPELRVHVEIVPRFMCRCVGISAALSLAGFGGAEASWGEALALGDGWLRALLAALGLLLLWWTSSRGVRHLPYDAASRAPEML